MEVALNSQVAKFGLSLKAEPSKTNVANTQLIGIESGSVILTTGGAGYSIGVSMASTGDECTLDLATGLAATSDTPISQVETATAAGTITLTGNATVTVTGARITGSPLAVSVAVLDTDTAATWAGKARAALAAVTAITDVYTVGGASTAISLTEIVPTNNDGTLNIALDNGTCTGITPAASSANTTAGVGGVKFLNSTGDGKDFEGVDLPTMTNVLGILIRVTNGIVTFADAGNTNTITGIADAPGYFMAINPGGTGFEGTLTVTASAPSVTWDATLVCSSI